MKKNLVIIACMSLLVFSSCKKDTTETPDEPKSNSFLPVKVGNYWIYEVYEIDTNGKATLLPDLDSCYVESDTMIDGKSYFKLVTNTSGWSHSTNVNFIRPEGVNLITPSGDYYFKEEKLNTILLEHFVTNNQDTLLRTTVYQEDGGNLAVKAGSFTTVKRVVHTENYKNQMPKGPNFPYSNTWFSKNTGVVQRDLPTYTLAYTYHQQRLLRYKLN